MVFFLCGLLSTFFFFQCASLAPNENGIIDFDCGSRNGQRRRSLLLSQRLLWLFFSSSSSSRDLKPLTQYATEKTGQEVLFFDCRSAWRLQKKEIRMRSIFTDEVFDRRAHHVASWIFIAPAIAVDRNLQSSPNGKSSEKLEPHCYRNRLSYSVAHFTTTFSEIFLWIYWNDFCRWP